MPGGTDAAVSGPSPLARGAGQARDPGRDGPGSIPACAGSSLPDLRFPETLEAASRDGAGPWQRFRHVVLPQLRPVSVIVIVIVIVIEISLANGLKSFDLIWVLTRGGPGRLTETLAVSMYQETFLLQHAGAGAAIAVVLTLIVLAASWLYLRRQLDAKGD